MQAQANTNGCRRLDDVGGRLDEPDFARLLAPRPASAWRLPTVRLGGVAGRAGAPSRAIRSRWRWIRVAMSISLAARLPSGASRRLRSSSPSTPQGCTADPAPGRRPRPDGCRQPLPHRERRAGSTQRRGHGSARWGARCRRRRTTRAGHTARGSVRPAVTRDPGATSRGQGWLRAGRGGVGRPTLTPIVVRRSA